MKISAVTCTYNEEKNIAKLIKSLVGVDEIIVADNNSTDKTAEIAKDMGVKVYPRNDKFDIPTKQDIKDFKKRYGYLPKFTTESKIPKSSFRNDPLKYAKNDWVFFPDADEIVTWDLEAIKKMLPLCDQIQCDFIHSHNPDGSPRSKHKITKLFRKSNGSFKGRIHDVWTGNKARVIYTDKMKIDHYKTHFRQGNVLYVLEYAVLKDNDLRSKFYLAREYFYYKEYEKALKLYKEYLLTAWWKPEICDAYLHMAKCAWQLHRGSEARDYCLQAINWNPNFKEAFLFMAEMKYKEDAIVWRKLAEIPDNSGVLFVRV